MKFLLKKIPYDQVLFLSLLALKYFSWNYTLDAYNIYQGIKG